MNPSLPISVVECGRKRYGDKQLCSNRLVFTMISCYTNGQFLSESSLAVLVQWITFIVQDFVNILSAWSSLRVDEKAMM